MSDNANLYAKFHASWDLNAPCLSTPSGERFSYADIHRLSGSVAQHLASCGVAPGDRVSVQAEKSVDFLLLYLGCLRGGFVFHPLNPAYTGAELTYFFTDAEPHLVIYDPDNPSKAGDIASSVGVTLQQTMSADGAGSFRDGYEVATNRVATEHNKPDDVAALLYSSGTTGQPKGIPLTHHNLSSNITELARAWQFKKSDVLLHALPMFHTHGLFIALSCSLITGSAVRYLAKFDADTIVDELNDATVMMGVPTYYTRLLNHAGFDAAVCRNIRLFTSGSAPLREDTFDAFEQCSGQRIVERYGMTETVILTTNPIDGARKGGTVGLPLAGVGLRIADDEDRELPQGEVGRIQVKGDNVFHEYWRKPDKTAEDFTDDGYFNTGDQGCIDEDGYVAIVGRAKDLIISGGLNVYPIEVELVVNECPGVLESAVIGAAHDDFGEAVVAVVLFDDAKQEFNEQAVRNFAREQLAGFKVPKRVVVIADLPRNAMGKVQKNLLRERYADIFKTAP